MKTVPILVRKTLRTLRKEGLRAAFAKATSRLRFARNTLVAARRMRSLAGSVKEIEESLDFALNFSVGDVTIAPVQLRSEIAALLRMLKKDPPRRILEIGTARGGTLFLLSRVARPDAVLASIDLPEGEFGGGYRPESIPLLNALPRTGQALRLIRADSHRPTTLDAVRGIFRDAPLDLLMIDGDHRYEGVRDDFAKYGPLVRPGGLIAIHDIVPGPTEHVGDVPRFWQEIRDRYESCELVRDWSQQGFGIGVLVVPADGVRADVRRR